MFTFYTIFLLIQISFGECITPQGGPMVQGSVTYVDNEPKKTVIISFLYFLFECEDACVKKIHFCLATIDKVYVF